METNLRLMKWNRIEDKAPKAGSMVLIFTPECLTTQAYYSGSSFHKPWGDEYPGSKQPKWWMELPAAPNAD